MSPKTIACRYEKNLPRTDSSYKTHRFEVELSEVIDDTIDPTSASESLGTCPCGITKISIY